MCSDKASGFSKIFGDCKTCEKKDHKVCQIATLINNIIAI